MMRLTLRLFLPLLAMLTMQFAEAGVAPSGDYQLTPGDSIRVFVYQYPDLTYDTRVTESGEITYPLVGAIKLGGLTLAAAESKITAALKDGGYVRAPQVHIVVESVGGQVSVLGQVSHPGPFPLQKVGTHLSEVLASAGVVVANTLGTGQGTSGADTVTVTGVRDEKPFRRVIDLNALFSEPNGEDDILVAGGDVVYVSPAPVYYVYGQVQRPGTYSIARGMTIEQAIAQAGGPTVAGSEGRLRLDRRSTDGALVHTHPDEGDPIHPDDVLFVPTSIF